MNISNKLKSLPFFRFLIPLIFGISFQINVNFFENKFTLTLVLIILFSAIFLTKKYSQNFRFRYLFGIHLSIIFFVLGIFLVVLNTKQSSLILNTSCQKDFYAKIIDQGEKKKKHIRFFAQLYLCKTDSNFVNLNDKILLWLPKDSLSKDLKIGDKIFFRSKVQKIKDLNNPKEFSFKDYWAFDKIFHQSFVKENYWKIQEKSETNFWQKIHYFRHDIMDIFKKYDIKGQNFAVLSALTLGYKKELNPETKQKFAVSGAMHILAVSGLHVGIIWQIFSGLLFFLDKKRIGQIVKAILLISILWSYAFLTGFSPSVIRASFMFSLMIIGETIDRQYNVYHAIAISAFFILIYNPFYLTKVGFQLSYSAVLSIVYFQPKIKKLISIYIKKENNFFNKSIIFLNKHITSLIAVATSAQIGTAPISLYYFNHFPNYFILTNLFVIILAVFIFYNTKLLLLTNLFPYEIISSFFAKTLNFILDILNFIVGFIENLPYAIFTTYLNYSHIVLFYFFLFSIILFLEKKRMKFIKFALFILILFTSIRIFESIKTNIQKKIIVYNQNKSLAIDLINGENCFSFFDEKLYKNQYLQQLYFYKNTLSLGIENKEINSLDEKNFLLFSHFFLKNNYFYFEGKKIFILQNSDFLNQKIETKLDIDYFILANNQEISIKKLLDYFNIKQLIIAGNNYVNKINRWEKECQDLEINYWNIKEKGAYVSDF